MKTPLFLFVPVFHIIVATSTMALTSSIRQSNHQGMDLLAVDNAFRHLTPTALEYLDGLLSDQASFNENNNKTTASGPSSDGTNDDVAIGNVTTSSSGSPSSSSNLDTADNNTDEDRHQRIISEMLIRRIVYKCLDKYREVTPPHQVEEALKFHTLPKAVQTELASRYGGVGGITTTTPPTTWFEALEQLRANNNNNNNNTTLWNLLLDHPMTSYVPVQCQSCGHVIPDDLRSPYTDAELGLTEDTPTEKEAPLVRGGWFRGPRPATVLVLTCTECGSVSRWFRSRDLTTILNPNRWGRLCGEQEDLRLDLANYLGIPIRTCIPLDWDHIWSEEYRSTFVSNDDGDKKGIDAPAMLHSLSSSSPIDGEWLVQDDNARNFAVRLDEGIGSWTGVLAICPDPERCCDVTDEYLKCRNTDGTGRADDRFASEMDRYRQVVEHARMDASGDLTQARTVNGYALQRTGFSSSDITLAMRRAVLDYGTRKHWYE